MINNIDSLLDDTIHWYSDFNFLYSNLFIRYIDRFFSPDDIWNTFLNNLIYRFLNKYRYIGGNLDNLGIL